MIKQTKTIIYVQENKQEFQELLCRVYAASKGYKVLYVTRDIEDVNLCDILLVANNSIISDEQIKYINDSNKLRKKDIEIVSISNQDDALESMFLAVDLFKESKVR